MFRPLGPLLLKSRGVWGWNVLQLFKGYIFCFHVYSDGRYVFELFAHETNLMKKCSMRIKHKINYLIPKEWYHILNIMKLETQRLQPTYSPPQNLKWLISRNSFFTFSYLENEIQHQIKRIENSKRTLCFIICCTKCHTKVVKLLSKYMIYTYSPAYAHFGFRKVGVSGTVLMTVLMVQLTQKFSTYVFIR